MTDISPALRAAIEQHRAVGHDTATTATATGTSTADVQTVWAEQDAINREGDVIGTGNREAPRHGTHSGYNHHRQHRRPPCRECAAAERQYQREYQHKDSGRPLRPCGTHSAFNRHRTRGETPCDDCTTAERKYQRDKARRSRAQKREAA